MIRTFALLPVVLFSAVHAFEVKVLSGFDQGGAGFQLDPVPTPALNDAGADAVFTIIDGERDGNGGELTALNDGKVPVGEDQPAANFFFRGGSDGGRIAVDLKSTLRLRAVNTYSWHSGSRGPQVYKLYGTDGLRRFDPAPKGDLDPAKRGWKLIAEVDTRPAEGNGGGQHAVSITAGERTNIGTYRYLLFDISRTQEGDSFGNTFFSEIDIIDADKPEPERLKALERIVKTYESEDGKYTYVIDSSKAPDLTEWSENELVPVIKEWYPKIVELLPSPGYRAPDTVVFEYKDDMGGTPAYATGHRISLNVGWYRGQLEREARGCAVHEMVHTVQSYWGGRRNNRNALPTPGWVTEGIADYIRWFLYEPESRGAEIHRGNLGNAKYDASYRITANFLDWVVRTQDEDLLQKLNQAAREGKYEEDLWKRWTGKTLEELGEEWRKGHEERIQG